MKAFAALMLVLLTAGTALGEAPPEQDYMLYCMGCHQQGGAGWAGRVPPLRGVDRFLGVPEGRAYLVRVPGVAHAGLSDARLATLLNWVLTAFGTSEFRPYTAEEVAPLRANSFLNATAARKAVLRRLAESGK